MINYNFLSPVDDLILSHTNLNSSLILGNRISVYNDVSSPPDLVNIDIVIVGVNEYRNSFFETDKQDLYSLRKELYKLKFSNWKLTITDLGNLPNGNTVDDTYHALYEICKELLSKKIIIIIIGGSNDIIYPIFKSFDSYNNKVNIVSIDNQFDLYQESDLVSGRTYMNKIIIDDSNMLNDFTNIGYQRHLCSHDELQLMEKLFFEYISLGQISENNMKAEPIMRNANIVGFDMKSLSFSASFNKTQGNPNGIDSRLACILSKYAGQSNKTNFLGLFELNNNTVSYKLYSEIIWYFLDGVDKRIIESDFNDSQTFNKYIVQTSGRDIIFYKSKVSEKWWMLIDTTKNTTVTYLPCLESDYLDALNDNIPIRWLKATKRI
jgi:hypothetical protein